MHQSLFYLCSESVLVFKTEKTINMDTHNWYLLIMVGLPYLLANWWWTFGLQCLLGGSHHNWLSNQQPQQPAVWSLVLIQLLIQLFNFTTIITTIIQSTDTAVYSLEFSINTTSDSALYQDKPFSYETRYSGLVPEGSQIVQPLQKR